MKYLRFVGMVCAVVCLTAVLDGCTAVEDATEHVREKHYKLTVGDREVPCTDRVTQGITYGGAFTICETKDGSLVMAQGIAKPYIDTLYEGVAPVADPLAALILGHFMKDAVNSAVKGGINVNLPSGIGGGVGP